MSDRSNISSEQAAGWFHDLVDRSLVGVYVVDLEGFLFVNERLAEIFGYPAGDLVGGDLHPLDLVHPDDRALVRGNLERRIHHDTGSVRYEFRGIHRSGRVIDLESRGRRAGEAGEPVVIGMLQDITERRQAERELRETMDRYRLLVEGSSEVFFYLHDVEQKIEYVSPSVEPVLGYDPSLLAGRSFSDLLAGPGQSRPLRRLLESTDDLPATIPPYLAVARRRSGERVILEMIESPLRRDGRVVGVHGFARDVTERFRAEEERDRLYREARQAIEDRDEILSVVSHDLRNPLHTIQMGVEILRTGRIDDADATERTMESIHRAADQMGVLIDDLLSVTHSGGGLTLRPRDIAVSRIVDDVRALMHTAARDRRVRLAVEIEGEISVVADRRRILQVLANLVGNAIRFTPAEGAVTIGGRPRDDRVELFVRDEGPGIPPETVPHIFERYWRGNDPGAGAGLGLTIVRGIVEAHGGEIEVETAPGAGATFRFTLPAKAGEGGGEEAV